MIHSSIRHPHQEFAFVTYKSKAHRNQVNARIFKDPAMNNFDIKDMPFELKRMAHAGFKVLVSA